MILFNNSLMVLDYDPATDILKVEWPNAASYLLPEIRHTLRTLVEHVRNYDIKKLLIDASQTKANPELTDSLEYKQIVLEFVSALAQTRLQKSARIIALDQAREAKTQKLTEAVKQEVNFSIQNKNFTTRAEAMAWLLE